MAGVYRSGSGMKDSYIFQAERSHIPEPLELELSSKEYPYLTCTTVLRV
jgi:hypothetical protein